MGDQSVAVFESSIPAVELLEWILDEALPPRPPAAMDWWSSIMATPIVVKLGMPKVGQVIEIWTDAGWKPARVHHHWQQFNGRHRVARGFGISEISRFWRVEDRDHCGPGGWRRDLSNLHELRRQFMIGGTDG